MDILTTAEAVQATVAALAQQQQPAPAAAPAALPAATVPAASPAATAPAAPPAATLTHAAVAAAAASIAPSPAELDQAVAAANNAAAPGSELDTLLASIGKRLAALEQHTGMIHTLVADAAGVAAPSGTSLAARLTAAEKFGTDLIGALKSQFGAKLTLPAVPPVQQ